jgi:large subunit ribosomal protein L9
MMKLILQEDVPNLGMVGELVTVRDGYGRNFLLPQRKAVHASPNSIKELEHQKRLAAHKRELATSQAEKDKKVIEALSIAINAKVAHTPAGDKAEGHDELQRLFGSITSRELAKIVSDTGIKVDHRKVTLAEPVRTVGKFEAKIRLNGGISAKLLFWVLPEGAADVEAEKQRVEAAQADSKKRAADAEAKRKAAEAALRAEKPTPVAAAPAEGEGEAQAEEASPEEAKPKKKGKKPAEASED